MHTHRRKVNLKTMKRAKSVLNTDNIYGIYTIKPKVPVQTYRNHTIHFNSEGQKYLKKHITVIMKELGISLISSKYLLFTAVH